MTPSRPPTATELPHDEALSRCLAQAERDMAAGRLPEAAAGLNAVLAANPESHAAWHAMGVLATAAGDPATAIECVVNAIAINGTVGLYHRNLGEMCRRMGHLDEAVLAGQRATELMPQDVSAHSNLGLAFSDCGQWAHAIRAYQRALTLQPEHGLTWNNIGVALERSGATADAVSAYARALQINPAHAEAQLNLDKLNGGKRTL